MESQAPSAPRRRVPIPQYTLGEELVNSISHGVGAALSIAALVLCLVKSVGTGDPYGVAGSILYGVSLIQLYATSAVYHALKPNLAKRVFRVLDHCVIFLLIAGTYSPYTLVALHGPIGWTIFGVIWGAAAVGIVFNAIDLERFKKFSLACYILMGWVIVLAFQPLLESMAAGGVALLIAGGVAYTIGAVIYAVGSKHKYMHSIWHFFVLAGSILHFFSIYLYVL